MKKVMIVVLPLIFLVAGLLLGMFIETRTEASAEAGREDIQNLVLREAQKKINSDQDIVVITVLAEYTAYSGIVLIETRTRYPEQTYVVAVWTVVNANTEDPSVYFAEFP